MVKTTRRSCGPIVSLVCAVLCAEAGCVLVPQAQLDECRQRGQALRAENDRLKDQVLTLRSENQDIAQRSVDDERRLKAQEAAIDRLEETARAYQDDRERLASAYEHLKSQLQGSAGPEASYSADSLKRFAEQHPGASFDDRGKVLVLSVESLFETGAATLRPGAEKTLADLAAALGGPDLRAQPVVLAPSVDDPSVQKTSAHDEADEQARIRFLAMARINQVRQRLQARHPGVVPGRIRIGDPDRPLPPGSGGEPAARIEIRLAHVRSPPGASGP